MNSKELKKLRELFVEEKNRRKKLNELLESEIVKKVLELSKTTIYKENEDINSIVEDIAKYFITSCPCNIYLWLGDYRYERYGDVYESWVEPIKEPLGSKMATYRKYKNIESKRECGAYIKPDKNNEANEISALNFERENIVLSASDDANIYTIFNQIRTDYYILSINYGLSRAKKLILDKYQRF